MTDSEIVNSKLLQDANIIVNNIYDLVNTKEAYPEAIHVLIGLIEEINDFNIKQGIVRALTVKEAKGKANYTLLKEYNKYNKSFSPQIESYCWAIGNAFTVIIQNNAFEDILEIIQDKQNGISRQMFIMALAKLPKRKMEAEDSLIDLLDDEAVILQTLYTLSRYKAQKAIPKIEMLLKNSNPFIQKVAQKSLAKFK